jgi:hypothetical protein
MRTVLSTAILACVFLPVAAAQGLPDNLTVTSSSTPPYQANLSVQTSGTVMVNGAGTTNYIGGQQVMLTPGFTAIATSGTTPTFVASIAPPPFYPNSGSGGSHNFTVTASDPGGYQNITNIQIIYNWQPSGADGCMLNYDVVNDALSIGDLTGSLSTFGSMSLTNPSGTLGDLVNSNCQIVGTGSYVTKSGNNVALFLGVYFRASQGSGDPTTGGIPGFIGPQNIYMMTTTADQQQPGSFQLAGSWTPFPVPEPGTFSSTIAPNSINLDGTVTLQFYDPNGFNYQPYGLAVLGSSYTDPNACRIRYDRGSGAVNHVLSLYAGDFAGVSLIGTAPVGSPGAVVQDAASCIMDIAHSYVVQESGTGAIVKVALSFKTTGTINTYIQGFDRQNVGGPLQQGSIFIAPNDFSLSQVNALTLQIGASATFSLGVTKSGTYAGSPTFTATPPANVSVSFQQNPLNTSTGNSETVVVSASSSAVAGNPTITITATDGSLSHMITVPLTITAPPPVTPPATISITGSQTIPGVLESVAVPFYISVTGSDNWPAGQTLSWSADPYAASQFLSLNFVSVAATAPGTTVVNATLVGTPVNGATYCSAIDVSSGGQAVAQTNICLGFQAGSQLSGVSFTLPATPPTIAVPAGGSVLTSAQITQYGPAAPAVTFSAFPTCPTGVSPCNATASLVTTANGYTISVNAGAIPAGTPFSESFSVNGSNKSLALMVSGASLAHGNFCGTVSGPALKLSTYNDGQPRSNSYVICGGVASSITSCSVSSSNITISKSVIDTTDFTLTATANTAAFSGTYPLSCSYPGQLLAIDAGNVVVYDAAPVITSVSPPTVTPGARTIAIAGHNFGQNPSVTVGNSGGCGLTQQFSGIGISTQTTFGGVFQIPTCAVGTTLPVTVTNTGENGQAFFQDTSNTTLSHAQSNSISISVFDNAPTITSIFQSPTQTLYPGAVAQANGVYIQIFGSNFGTAPGSVTICTHNVILNQPCIASGITANITNSSGNPFATWTNTQVNALLTASASTPVGLYDVWVNVATDSGGGPYLQAPGGQSTVVYGNGVSVSAINIQLQRVGPTVISTDGNYTEDTTVSVTAVAADGGAVVSNFTGTVNIGEVGTPAIYSQNGGSLKPFVQIISGGTATLLASSLAGPSVAGQYGIGPQSAILTSTNYPVYRSNLSIEQWIISGGSLDVNNVAPGFIGAVFDWVQARIIDIYKKNPPGSGDLATVLASVQSFTLASDVDAGGYAYPAHAAKSAVYLNPFSSALRANSDAGFVCGNPRFYAFQNAIAHEARHAYQNTVSFNLLWDSDQDFLANTIPIPPSTIFYDSADFRPVCNDDVSPPTPESRQYQGDKAFDPYDNPTFPQILGGHVKRAIEMDAYTFAANHDHDH